MATHDGDTFRADYTVKFAKAVYVLHPFQKKSGKGSKAQAAAHRGVDQPRVSKLLRGCLDDFSVDGDVPEHVESERRAA